MKTMMSVQYLMMTAMSCCSNYLLLLMRLQPLRPDHREIFQPTKRQPICLSLKVKFHRLKSYYFLNVLESLGAGITAHIFFFIWWFYGYIIKYYNIWARPSDLKQIDISMELQEKTSGLPHL